MELRKMAFPVLFISLSTSVFFLYEANSGVFKTPALIKSPSAISSSVSDAYMYAMVKYHKAEDRFTSVRNISYPVDKKPPPLCQSEKIPSISPVMLRRECRLIEPVSINNCKNINGCVGLRVDNTVKEEVAAWELLIKTVKNPCEIIPNPQTGEFSHRVGFFYTPIASRSILACDKSTLPYNEVHIVVGEEIFSITVNLK